jgi:sulfur carrier protein
MIQLIVNGQPQFIPAVHRAESVTESPGSATLNITQLLEHMGLQGRRIAVERNGEIVPRSKFDQPLLADGDRLEIVVAVGGG